MNKILILGKIPPPVGGVTNHVSRLLKNLPHYHFTNFAFCDLATETVWRILCKILKHNIFHLHISSPWLQFLFALYCKISRKKLLLTYHGNWGRYHLIGNWLVSLSAWLANVPIVQNESSLAKARRWNKRVILISTHLPPPPLSSAGVHISRVLENFRIKHKIVLCTNAWNLAFDKNGKEVYGISDIIGCVSRSACVGLIISDPSGNYQTFIHKSLGSIPENITFITQLHDFRHILLVSDAFIRNTTTDGVSLSIHEAAELNVPVLASAAVARPAFCKVFNNLEKIDFRDAISEARALLQKTDVREVGGKAMETLVGLYFSMMRK